MNRIQDKLAQSVRQARGTPDVATPQTRPAAKAVVKAHARPAPKPSAGGEPAASADALFPTRVWPD